MKKITIQEKKCGSSNKETSAKLLRPLNESLNKQNKHKRRLAQKELKKLRKHAFIGDVVSSVF